MTAVKQLRRQDWAKKLTAAGEDYELIAGQVWGRPCQVFKNAPPHLRALFNDNRSDEIFLVYQQERYSFEQSYQEGAKIAAMLRDQYGIQKGDRVAISMRNYPEWVMAFNAITSMGAVAVCLNALWTADEMAYGLKDSGAKVLFADQERLDRLAPVHDQLDLKAIAVRPSKPLAAGVAELSELLQGATANELPDTALDASDPATLFYTSGSTGHPKGVLSCHANILSALMSWELELTIHAYHFDLVVENPPEPEFQPATLLGVPLFHVTGSHAVFLMCYRSQRKLVCMYKWDAEQAASLIAAEKVQSFVAPAAMTGDLLEYAKDCQQDLSSLIAVGGGGAARAADQVKSIASSFEQALPNTGWGMTETNAIGAGIGGEDYVNHPTSTGHAATIADVKIINEAGDTLACGERGEILIAGATVCKGYWNRPDATTESFSGDYLHTGDVGYFDEEGYLYIVDRIKDLVIRGGENIGCAEVESALIEHEAILEACVYGVPDQRLGEEVAATLYCNNALDLDELRGFLKSHLASFKIPRHVLVKRQPLPRIAAGKIDKKLLRAEAEDHLDLS